jgi:large subunit ribosomal protein L2
LKLDVNRLKYIKLLPDKVRQDLNISQLRNALKMHQKGLKLPRHMLNIDPLTVIPRKGCHPALSEPLRKKGGRNHHGKITCRHRGGGFKRRIRILDTSRETVGPFKIIRLEHDPNRSAKIALVKDTTSRRLSYILAWDGAQAGQVFENVGLQLPGTTLPLADLSPGTRIHNIDGRLCRSAGCKATLVGKDGPKAIIRMPSGQQIRLPLTARATVGTVSNPEWHLRILGSAGRRRNLGWRPTVRGVAMNAVDHPHGGGKGGKSKGKPSQSPWGKICK